MDPNMVAAVLETLDQRRNKEERRRGVRETQWQAEQNTLCLSNEELSMIHLTIEALRPFEEATREVSAEKHVSVSKVIPLVLLLLRAAAATERQGSSLATELALQCQRRFRGIETFHSLDASAFLDIRFKNLAFRDRDNVETMKKRMLTEMQEVHQPTSESPPPGSTSAPVPSSASAPMPRFASPVTPASTPSSAPATAKGGIWADFDIQVLSAQQHRSTGFPVFSRSNQTTNGLEVFASADLSALSCVATTTVAKGTTRCSCVTRGPLGVEAGNAIFVD
ncbi:UNVERIFIED_CONTAM: hypothetical protein FKN15_054257 [Acipenser sinensis]